MLGAIDNISTSERVRIVVTLTAEPEPRAPIHVIASAIRSHFFHEERRLDRRIRRHYRIGQLSLALGLTVLIVFLFLAEHSRVLLPPGHVTDILAQGLTVVGWVAMWRPLEILL